MFNSIKENKGITLVALVVTVIILLILAGISIAQLTGNGLFEKAKLTKEKSEKTQEQEYSILKEYEEKIQGIRNSKFEESKIISDFTIVTKNVFNNKITINLSENTSTENVIGYIVFIGNDAIDVTNTMPYDISNLQKNTEYKDIYVVAIDNKGNMKKSSNKLNERTENMLTEGLVDYWNFENSLENAVAGGSEFEIYQGSPEFKENSLYLNDSVIATKQNYTLNSTYTILIQTKNIVNNGVGFIISMGYAAAGLGGTSLGFYKYTDLYAASSGAGDAYHMTVTDNYENGIWHTFAIKYDGTNFSFFIDNTKVGTSGASTLKTSKLYVGGISNSGSYGAGLYWGYGNGYYKNLAIYNRALTDAELESYSF